jgi:hypothetical protein
MTITVIAQLFLYNIKIFKNNKLIKRILMGSYILVIFLGVIITISLEYFSGARIEGDYKN